MLQIEENKSLKDYNTFHIDVNAKYFVSINNIEELELLVNNNIFKKEKIFIIGGGSNLLFTKDFDGLIISIALNGILIIEKDSASVLLEVSAGQQWHSFVEYCVNHNYYGLENLALIPGNAGAAPVQNIGAYGTEQCDRLHSVKIYNLEDKQFQTLSAKECRFAYRDSIFKHELNGKAIVISAIYKLSLHREININYKDLLAEFSGRSIESVTLPEVFEAVCRVRESKLPDYTKIGNAGSFYKNPVVSQEHFLDLLKKYPEIPNFKSESGVKIPAAYLIEKIGYKGLRKSDAGVYSGHSLILVNYSDASGKDIFNLSEEIIEKVKAEFNIRLEREVIVL